MSVSLGKALGKPRLESRKMREPLEELGRPGGTRTPNQTVMSGRL